MKLVRISAIWCTSCILTYKDWCNIKEKHQNLSFEEIDYDECDTEKYNVGDTLPVIIVYENDKEIDRIIGEKREKEIEEHLRKLGL